MRNIVFIIGLAAVFWTAPLFAQKLSLSRDSSKQNSSTHILTNLDRQPSFIGGQDSLWQYLQTSIHYPSLPRRKGIEGTVYVVFSVDADGEILDPKVKHFKLRRQIEVQDSVSNEVKIVYVPEKYDEELEREAVRVVAEMPNWQPALYKGKPLKVPYVMPVKFKLE